MNEALQKLGLELSLTNVDSLANDFLKATNIESTITIYLLNTDTVFTTDYYSIFYR